MTIFVTWQSRVTLDSICKSFNVYLNILFNLRKSYPWSKCLWWFSILPIDSVVYTHTFLHIYSCNTNHATVVSHQKQNGHQLWSKKTRNKSERKYSGRHYFRQRKQEVERFPPSDQPTNHKFAQKAKFWLFFNSFIRPRGIFF